MPTINRDLAAVAAHRTAKAMDDWEAAKEPLKIERERRLAAGKIFTTSWGASIPMTGRPFDQTVILGLTTRAQAYLSQGDLVTTITYRDGHNRIHELTAMQWLELSQLSMTWFEAVMAASWAMIDSGTIPTDFTNDIHWPA